MVGLNTNYCYTSWGVTNTAQNKACRSGQSHSVHMKPRLCITKSNIAVQRYAARFPVASANTTFTCDEVKATLSYRWLSAHTILNVHVDGV